MTGAWVIAGKDLRNLFMSPLFYVLAGICAVAWSFLFTLSLSEFLSRSMLQMMQNGGGEGAFNLHFTVIAKHISLVNLLMIFSVAALTMRLFTEEKRNRTFDLLLTSPVTATQIVAGKIIAGTLTAWALVLVSLLYPLSLAVFGKLDWGPLASSYIGLMMLTACYVAIGVFASSLTESSVLAVIMALIFNVMLWFMGAASEATEGGVSKKVFEHLNIGSHYLDFLKGSFSIPGLVFFMSVVLLFGFLTQRVVESTRWK